MDNFIPTISQTTTTTDLINQCVEAVQAGATLIELGRFRIRWEDNAWIVHDDGCEQRACIGGRLLAIPHIVRCWLKDTWVL